MCFVFTCGPRVRVKANQIHKEVNPRAGSVHSHNGREQDRRCRQRPRPPIWSMTRRHSPASHRRFGSHGGSRERVACLSQKSKGDQTRGLTFWKRSCSNAQYEWERPFWLFSNGARLKPTKRSARSPCRTSEFCRSWCNPNVQCASQ